MTRHCFHASFYRAVGFGARFPKRVDQGLASLGLEGLDGKQRHGLLADRREPDPSDPWRARSLAAICSLSSVDQGVVNEPRLTAADENDSHVTPIFRQC